MMKSIFPALILLTSCSAISKYHTPTASWPDVTTQSSSNLCSAYRSEAVPNRTKLMIETELAARNQRQCLGANYGTYSAANIGLALYPRPNASYPTSPSDLRNCDDFSSGAQAQSFFLANGGPTNDPNNLDSDGDGLACEWGAQAQQLSTYRPPEITPVRPRYSSSRCYTGPRGGRYTITSSGNRNYGGC